MIFRPIPNTENISSFIHPPKQDHPMACEPLLSSFPESACAFFGATEGSFPLVPVSFFWGCRRADLVLCAFSIWSDRVCAILHASISRLRLSTHPFRTERGRSAKQTRTRNHRIAVRKNSKIRAKNFSFTSVKIFFPVREKIFSQTAFSGSHIRAFFRTQESKIVKEIILLVFLSRKEQTNRSANIFFSVLKGFEAQTIVLLIVSKILQQQEKQT